MSVVVGKPDDIHALVGSEIGASSWIDIGQDRIDGFAAVTGDDQWIHTDPIRAAGTPSGTTIAHGYLTLSLLIPLLEEIMAVENRSSSINYGLDRVRFPAPVPAGSRVRMSATVVDATDVDSGVQVTIDCVFHVAGRERPACVARAILRHHFEDD